MTPVRRACLVLAGNVARIRAAKGLSMEAAAKLGGLNRDQWGQVEAAETPVTLGTLMGLAQAFDVSIAELCGASQQPVKSLLAAKAGYVCERCLAEAGVVALRELAKLRADLTVVLDELDHDAKGIHAGAAGPEAARQFALGAAHGLSSAVTRVSEIRGIK